jgi:hypothetical protein
VTRVASVRDAVVCRSRLLQKLPGESNARHGACFASFKKDNKMTKALTNN